MKSRVNNLYTLIRYALFFTFFCGYLTTTFAQNLALNRNFNFCSYRKTLPNERQISPLQFVESVELVEPVAVSKPPLPRHLSIRWLGLSWHPGGGSLPQFYRGKLDPRGEFVVSPGAVVAYDWSAQNQTWLPKWLSKRSFFRVSGAYYRDCAFLHSAYLHFGGRLEVLKIGRHSLNLGGGPTFFLRQDWHRLEGYRGNDFFGKNVYRGWQYQFFPIGGEIEYLLKLKNGVEFQYSLVPGYPTLVVSQVGVRWKLKK